MTDRFGARGRTLADGAHAESDFVDFAESETEQSIPDRFEKQAGKFPNRIAVRVAGREFTYDALNRIANRIARAILEIDAEGEQRVAMMLDQDDPLLTAAIIGILKAGKIYVPIDPSYPPARTSYILEDSQVALIVAATGSLSLARELAGDDERRVLNIDEIGAGLSDENPGLPISPDATAYIIYTSGSTGQPKGVIQTHRNLLRYVRNYTNSWRVRTGDRLTLFFSPSVSQSLMDIFGALLKGASLYPYNVKQEGLANLATWLIGEGITVFDSVPTLYRHFLDTLTGDEEFPELRLIRLGGEQVSRELVRRSRKHFPDCVLVNQLAATETSMIAQYFIDKGTEIAGSTVPVGHAVDGVEVLLIDEAGDEVGFGQVGEIAIKSRYLSPGYWRKPNLTRAAFGFDPRGGSERLYHTGDLGRMRPDGGLEHLGRKDSRVKIRGHSVEIAEIEEALLDLGNVKEAAVTAQEFGQDDKRLVAYIVPRHENFPTVGRLRAALAEKVPDYMVPSAFVCLPALPLTPNGKLDRRALPEPDEERPDLERAYEAPRIPVEEALAGIWAEILRLERVGVHDDFFELGGHSLLATQVVSRVREAFQVKVPLRSLFEEPTVARLAKRIEEARRVEQSQPPPPLVPLPRDARSPLSFSQQRMWLVDQLEPGTSNYNTSKDERLIGRLNIPALERSLNEIVRRHEVLRTRFEVVNGEPVQVIAPAQEALEVPLIDLSELPQAEREAEARRLAREEGRRPYDLERGPLFRARLLKLNEEEHVLLIGMHHIVSDGWSMGVFRRELKAHYDAFCEGRPSPLAELPIQYADYALWQREWLRGEVLEEQLSYWKEQLAGVAPLQLPTDHPRPAIQTHRGGRQELVLPESLTEALKALSRQEGTTLFMVLLGAFQVLLSRYSGQEDIAVGTPIAGRKRAETEGLIGFFVNTLVMRTDLFGDPSFRELLGQVREVALDAYEHQDLPFEKLVEELNPERDLSRTPLFQVFLNMLDVDDAPIELSGLTAERVMQSDDQAIFDLALYAAVRREGIHLKLFYNADLFDDVTIGRMGGHFQNLLEGIVEDPQRHLSELPILSEAERYQLLFEWNDTKTEFPENRCIHELFEEQAQRTPEAVAVVCGDEHITYRELNEKANRLAHYLQNLGVGPEVPVGVFLHRSLEMVVGVLAVLKAGGAYVPFDPEYPRERLAFLLEDVRARVLLTQQRLVEGLPKHAAQVVLLDADQARIDRETNKNPAREVIPENLAYVVYTSGSTGEPKGTLITHRSLVNAYFAYEEAYRLRTDTRCHLQMANFTFDVFAGDLIRALCSGGKLVLCPKEVLLTPQKLHALMCQEQVDCAEFVPAVLRHLSRHLEQQRQRLDFMRVLVCSSDSWYVEEYNAFRRVCGPQTRLINAYGLTEATIDSTYFECATLSLPGGQLVPIGRPLANTRVYLLDQHMQPVPVGVPGEIYIGGVALARGYLGRPALTAERFVPDPFSDEPGARLYRTGDRARYRADGNIELLGRIDQQLKVRGFRVEPGEIETVLRQHPAVREAVGVAGEDASGDKRLAAYIVPVAGTTPSPRELRSYLKEKLPEYMVPSAFVFLDELPLTPNGKVDRRALPAPERLAISLDDAYVAPRTPVEEALAEIWADVLGLEQVGAHDDFFELGGHSLLATQLISRVRDVFQVELPLRSLFEAPTVAGLAERIEAARRGAQGRPAQPPLLPVPRDGRLPLSFAQQRLWFLQQLEPNSSLYNVFLAKRLSGVLDVGALRRALGAIVERHEVLRTTFAEVDGGPVQVIAPTLSVELPIEDLSGLPEGEREAQVRRLAREEARRPFDLERGPLLRARLLRLGDEEHMLFLTMHHIVSDAWSMDVFWPELGALYEAFSSGKPSSPLAELPIQYADFAVWQREWLQGEALETQLSYWKGQLAELPALELPTDRPRPVVQTHQGARQSLTLPESLSEALKGLSRREGVTLFMVLLAAFQTLLSRYTGQDDIAVGTPIAGRNQSETERLVGFFLNTLVMRTDLSGDPTFRELLGRVREVCLGAYDHQDLPFERLVEELNPERDLSRTPLFQVFLNMHDVVGGAALELGGLSTETVPRFELGEAPSIFDITLYVWDRKEGITLRAAFNTDLFEQDTIGQILRHFQVLLEGVVADPERRLSEVPLLSEEERRWLSGRGTNVVADKGVHPTNPFTGWAKEEIEQSIPQRFERQVWKYPHNIAVKTPHHEWTYAQLNAKANRVARTVLARIRDEPATRVAMLKEHGAPMIAGLLGVLKAGKTYVPLDPSHPEERLAYMLQDAQAGAVLTDEANLALATILTEGELQLINVDELGLTDNSDSSVGAADVEDIDLAVSPESVAYILYTSGSTGEPKGVVQNHRNVLHFIRAYTNNLHIGADDRLTLLSSYAHDAALMDIFGALLNGATLYPIDLKAESLATLVEQLVEQEITIYHSTPTIYRHFADALSRAEKEFPGPRLVVLGGEAVYRKDVELYKTHFSEDCLFVNLQGSTESSVNLLCYIDQETPLRRHAVPTGHAVEETEILLLDEASREAEVYGEIAIRSPYVALGYWQKPELSQKVFLPDPAGGDTRIYRTGDMGRLLPDGAIEWRGRKDHQVKIRGYRVELGEIEATLNRHSSVHEVTVMTREEDDSGEQRLVAYIVPRSHQALTDRELRGYLKERLPEYMVPSAFVFLDKLPLTPNGKVDRKALPAPEDPRAQLEDEFVAPRGMLEERVAGIWTEVLRVERVGAHEDFFELGGNSLLVTLVISRLRDVFQVELPVRSLFEEPTVAGLAERVEAAQQSDPVPSTVALGSVDHEEGLL